MPEVLEMLFHALWHSFLDTLKILPFLFLAYLLLEVIEHKGGAKAELFIRKAGKAGPLVGGLAGAVPQCGFAAVAAEFYGGRIITVGTLVAVFLSSSDEMIPVLVTGGVPLPTILLLLLVKILVGVFFGFLVDLLLRLLGRERPLGEVSDLCEREGCHCEKGIFRSALHHTLYTTLYIFAVTFVLTATIECVGEDTVKSLFSDHRWLSLLLAGVLGMIPNCASSVVLTELYVENVIGVGALLSGLLPGAGVGILALFRANRRDRRGSALILLLLFAIGLSVGALFEFTPLGAIFA